MIDIILMIGWGVLGGLIADELGFSTTAQVIFCFIGVALAAILIEML